MKEHKTIKEVPEAEVEACYRRLTELPIIADVLKRLETELGEEFTYHSAAHTQDVLHEVLLFALTDGLAGRDIELLAIAAAYHDTGFLISKTENEADAAKMASQAMEKTGNYSVAEVELVAAYILDTRLVETPTGPKQLSSREFSGYLLDADLSNLGRKDFLEKGELYRIEVGFSEDIGLQKGLEILGSHSWHTEAAKRLRTDQKKVNVARVRAKLNALRESNEHVTYYGVSLENLGFLSRLPVLLTSSMDPQTIIDRCLSELGKRLDAEAATVFLCNGGTEELTFWALSGGGGDLLGRRMPKGRGIVGWVIDNNESIVVNDVSTDPRFFEQIDKEGSFTTRDVMCVPLRVRGNVVLGAIQVLNSRRELGFDAEDLVFVEHVSHQLSMAIDNAHLYEKLRERNKQLAILDQRKNEMITIITHEFRTPLNVIQTSSEMLSGDMISDKKIQERIAGTLGNGVRRLTKLIAELRKLSQVSDRKMEVSKTEIVVSELFDSLAAQFVSPLEERKLALASKLPEDVTLVSGDPTLIAVVLNNLISNAIRFTADGGQITITAEQSAGLVEIAVEDTGIGIADEQLPLIFEKFYEVGSAMEHSSGSYEFKSGGLGLGLPTVRAILEAHGSGINVESTEGKGSRFSFRLPCEESK